MLDLLSEHSFMPSGYLLVLHVDPVVSLQLADDLVRLVLLSVRELLILSSNQLDRLVSVVRTFDSSEEFPLQLLESFAFFNGYVKLPTFRCCYVRLYAKV